MLSKDGKGGRSEVAFKRAEAEITSPLSISENTNEGVSDEAKAIIFSRGSCDLLWCAPLK